jgi:hypothetical protein
MAPGGPLGENQTVIYGNLEPPTGRRHELDLRVRKLPLQLSRQTGGSWLVVSDDAILDDHAHAAAPLQGKQGRIVVLTQSAAKPEPASKRGGRAGLSAAAAGRIYLV